MHEKKGGPAPEGNEQGLDLPAGYEAGAFLAKGGMGEILSAGDERLDREVGNDSVLEAFPNFAGVTLGEEPRPLAAKPDLRRS